MNNQKRIEDYGVIIGKFPKGKFNKITDVKGVRDFIKELVNV